MCTFEKACVSDVLVFHINNLLLLHRIGCLVTSVSSTIEQFLAIRFLGQFTVLFIKALNVV